MPTVIRCSRCRRRLSAPLRSQTLETCEQDGEPFLARGHWVFSDGDKFAATEGAFIIHVDDRRHLRDHRDRRRLTGCCGPDGTSGPNQVCVCKAAVATLKGDCWHPHCVIFEPGKVELVEAEQARLRESAEDARRRLGRGLFATVAFASIAAAAATWHSWWLNPGGVFRGEVGTEWCVAWETWSSWFFPLFALAALLVAPFCLRLPRRRSTPSRHGTEG